ncbi:MAG: HAMP domain-containing histidine kinase [Deltaproteobacteria bacterium]|nr:HAMP domain-containing histidine kinase [Deltaproteobacteria bacterium]
MRFRAVLISVILMGLAALLVFHFFQRQLTRASNVFAAPPEVLAGLEDSLEDLKHLAHLEPERQAEYRRRFDQLETTVQRLRILEHGRADLQKRYEQLLLALFLISVIAVTGIYAWRQSRHGPRLTRLQEALRDLAAGSTEVRVGDRGRDTIGRIGRMVEHTSNVMAKDRQRLASLENLSSWQEAARRHAHEMRTPLTTSRLEIERLAEQLEGDPSQRATEHRHLAESALEELDRLSAFTRRFTSFARLPRPRLLRQDLGHWIEEFFAAYQNAWDNLTLKVATRPGITGPNTTEPGITAPVDRDMLRQVLVNLCDNAATALGARSGSVALSLTAEENWVLLDVTDDGPGIPEDIRSRVFEPYTTTSTIGEGMGLGLAISKKIMLDHHGNLELLSSSASGTTFRLTLPRREAHSG